MMASAKSCGRGSQNEHAPPFGLGGLAMHGTSVLILTDPFSYPCNKIQRSPTRGHWSSGFAPIRR